MLRWEVDASKGCVKWWGLVLVVYTFKFCYESISSDM